MRGERVGTRASVLNPNRINMFFPVTHYTDVILLRSIFSIIVLIK